MYSFYVLPQTMMQVCNDGKISRTLLKPLNMVMWYELSFFDSKCGYHSCIPF